MDLTDLLLNTVNNDGMIDMFSQNLNADKDQIASATKTILPALLEGMNQNIQSKMV